MLDAAAFLNSSFLPEGELYTTPSVLSELKSEKRFLVPEDINVREPGREFVERVRRLAAVLRLADAMDRDHLQRVRYVTVTPSPDGVELVLNGEGDLLLEKWALKKKSGLFAEVFGYKVRIAG